MKTKGLSVLFTLTLFATTVAHASAIQPKLLPFKSRFAPDTLTIHATNEFGEPYHGPVEIALHYTEEKTTSQSYHMKKRQFGSAMDPGTHVETDQTCVLPVTIKRTPNANGVIVLTKIPALLKAEFKELAQSCPEEPQYTRLDIRGFRFSDSKDTVNSFLGEEFGVFQDLIYITLAKELAQGAFSAIPSQSFVPALRIADEFLHMNKFPFYKKCQDSWWPFYVGENSCEKFATYTDNKRNALATAIYGARKQFTRKIFIDGTPTRFSIQSFNQLENEVAAFLNKSVLDQNALFPDHESASSPADYKDSLYRWEHNTAPSLSNLSTHEAAIKKLRAALGL